MRIRVKSADSDQTHDRNLVFYDTGSDKTLNLSHLDSKPGPVSDAAW